MTRQLTIRGVPAEVAERLERMSRDQGRSINATVNLILENAVGGTSRRRHLERYATWSQPDLIEFEKLIEAQRVIDDRLWR